MASGASKYRTRRKYTRRKRVPVKGYCRRKGERAWQAAARKAKEWGF